MLSTYVLALVIQSAWAEIGGCSANLDSCHSEVPVNDATTLLQQRMVDRVEHGVEGLKAVTNWVVREEKDQPIGGCPEGEELAYGDACDTVDPFGTTTPAPLCVDGKTASGKACQGKIKIRTINTGIVRPCKTASGDECEGEFPKKLRYTYKDKDGKWVLFKREQSQDGEKTWSPLPVSLAEMDTFTLTDDEADTLIPYDSCCIPSTTTASPSPSPSPIVKDCELGAWTDWTACSVTCGSGTRSRSREVLSPGDPAGKCGCTEEADSCQLKECPDGPIIEPSAVVTGTVKDGKTNNPIAGATVRFASVNDPVSTGPDGSFEISVKVGPETLTAQAEQYTSTTQELIIKEGMHINIKMIKLVEEGEWTIVMTWEKQPTDLEAVTTFGECNILPYDNEKKPRDGKQSCEDASGMSGKLDIDNRDIQDPRLGDGPETTTLTKVNAFAGTIYFRVDNWERVYNPSVSYCKEDNKNYDATKCGPIADSNAVVEVYGPGRKPTTFTVGKKDGDLSDDGKHWYVFSMDANTGKLSPCKRGGGCK